MIRNESTTRATTPNSTREIIKVDQGKHPSAILKTFKCDTPNSNARTGYGPGVFVSGAAPRRHESDRHGMTVVAVRNGP